MKHLQLDYVIKQVLAMLVTKQDDVNMVMAIKIGKRITDEFEKALAEEVRGNRQASGDSCKCFIEFINSCRRRY